jgi:hypothetical protein
MMALIPALGLVLLYDFVRQSRLNRDHVKLFLAILLPAVLVLGWQYLFLYGPQSQSAIRGGSASIAFAPFEVFTVWWQVPGSWIVVEAFLSILFPLVTYLVYLPQARQDRVLNVAWLVYLVGIAQMYLFIEIPNQASGNFLWGGRITSLVLFVASAGFLMRQNAAVIFQGILAKADWRFVTVGAVFVLHLGNTLADLL